MENGDAPATKLDIALLKKDLDQGLDQLRSEVNHGYSDLVERMADGETRLLKAFYSFGESSSA